MSTPAIDAALFRQRLTRFFDHWKNAGSDGDFSPLDEVASILLVAGNSDESNPYFKTSAIQTYFLTYEFPSTITLFLRSPPTAAFLLSEAKAKILKPLEGDHEGVTVKLIVKSKDVQLTKAAFGEVISEIENTQKPVGLVPKDKYKGKFVDEWTKFLEDEKKSHLLQNGIDVAPGLSTCLAIKDDVETQNSTIAASMTSMMMSAFCDDMMKVIEADKKITHEKMSDNIELRLEDSKIWSKAKFPADFEASLADWCYTPIIQSGGNYDLKTSASSDDQRLRDKGVILANLGIRYRSYCANMGRTFIIDPHKTQEQNYKYLLDLQTFAISQFKVGETLGAVYNKIREKVASDREDLEAHFPKSIGFGVGLEFRDSAYSIGAKSTRKVQKGMFFSLSLSFGGLDDPKNSGKTYALQVVDTIKVGDDGGEYLTEGLKAVPDMTFYFNDDAEEAAAKSKSNGKKSAAPRKSVANTVAPRKARLRNEGKEVDDAAANRRIQHQRELSEKKQEEGLAKWAEDSGQGADAENKTWKAFQSYQREKDIPSGTARRKIFIDVTRRTILLPINGFSVPFHINTLKNVVKLEEGEFTVLRFMFVAPGQITGKKEDTPFEDPTATFIRGLTLKNTDSVHMNDVYRQITELKKAVTKREKDKVEMSDVVSQDNLQEIKNRRPIRLLDISLRPTFDGKRNAGDVEIHSNGIRYISNVKTEQKVDILFANIRHLFFQPCDQELIVVLHIHLKNPILVGKKKAKDIQFFREASEAAFDETQNRKRRRQYGDEDEIEAEQDERKKRAELNRQFKAFADKIAEVCDGRFEVDLPYRELGFQGVPFRANVLMMPTTECLVHLIEPPFLVVTLADIEVAHLERVQFGLKNFDLVFVLKDFKKPPLQINTIPTGQLENVKEWLDSADIAFSEGPVNLSWGAIMKTVNEDPYDFFRGGGWSFLGTNNDSSESDKDEEEAESDFKASSSDAGQSTQDSESAYSDGSASDAASGSEEEDEEEGEEWSDLDRNAKKADERKKQTKKGGGGGGGKKRRDDDSDSDVSIDSSEEERKSKKKGKGVKR